MTTFAGLSNGISDALHIPLGEVKGVARRQGEARRQGNSSPGARRGGGAVEAARLLAGVMVMRIEGPTTPAAALTADIERLTRLSHGAALYVDADFILPPDFIGAVAEILAALADPRRCERVQNWIGRIGLARGGGRMAGWIEVRGSDSAPWEDFDYAASSADLVAILDAAIVRQVEVRITALHQIASSLA